MVTIHWLRSKRNMDPEMPMNVLVDIMPTTDVPERINLA
jgi:hypothetical protein